MLGIIPDLREYTTSNYFRCTKIAGVLRRRNVKEEVERPKPCLTLTNQDTGLCVVIVHYSTQSAQLLSYIRALHHQESQYNVVKMSSTRYFQVN